MTILERIHADTRHQAAQYQKRGRGERAVFPVLTEREIADAEARLGFSLPPLLRDIYFRVGNGGVCIGPGLMGIGYENGPWKSNDALAVYFEWCSPPPWAHGMFHLHDWGCCAWSIVDCLSPPYAVYIHDGNLLGSDSPETMTDDEYEQANDAIMADYRARLMRRDFTMKPWIREADSLEEWCELWLDNPQYGYTFRDDFGKPRQA